MTNNTDGNQQVNAAAAVTTDTQQRRENYFTFVDQVFCDRVHAHFAKSTYLTDEQRRRAHNLAAQWSGWLHDLIEGHRVDAETGRINATQRDMPSSFDAAHVLPGTHAASTGVAGSGKSVMGSFLVQTTPLSSILSYTNRGANAALAYQLRNKLPGGLRHNLAKKTLCTHYRIDFSTSKTRVLLDDMRRSQRMQDSMARLVDDTKPLNDRQLAETLTRRAFLDVSTAGLNVIRQCYNNMVHDFIRFKDYRYRNMVLDSKHPYYQPVDCQPPAVRRLHEALLSARAARDQERVRLEEAATVAAAPTVNGRKRKRGIRITQARPSRRAASGAYQGISEDGKLNITFDLTEMDEIIESCHAIRTQEDYALHVSMMLRGRRCAGPPARVLNPLLVYEEDGRTPGELLFIRAILDFLLLALYNPPYWHVQPPAEFVSGSATQSNCISSSVSALEIVTGPAFFSCKDETVYAFRAEMSRRAKNEFNDPNLAVCTATFQTLENRIEPIPETYTAMIMREEFESLVNDPGHLTEGTRFFGTHDDVTEFIEQSKRYGANDLHVRDTVYVLSNLALLDYRQLANVTLDADGRILSCLIDKRGLSKLTEAQARRNRMLLWRAKMTGVYVSDSLKCVEGGEDAVHPPVLEYDTGDNYTCNSELESRNSKAFRAHVQKFREATVVRRGTAASTESPIDAVRRMRSDLDEAAEEELVDVEEQTDVVAPTLSHLDNQARDQIDYDMEEGAAAASSHRRVKKRRKRRQGADGEDDGADGTAAAEEHSQQTQTSTISSRKFISGPAHLLLSTAEHTARRMYAEAQAAQLGNGKTLAKAYFRSVGVIDHVADFTVNPHADVVVEYGNPTGLVFEQQQCERSINERAMYSCLERVRTMPAGSVVTNEAVGTRVEFIGMNCTVDTLLLSPMFNDHAPTAFRAMLLHGVLQSYVAWLSSGGGEDADESSTADTLRAFETCKAYSTSSSACKELVSEFYAVTGTLLEQYAQAGQQQQAVKARRRQQHQDEDATVEPTAPPSDSAVWAVYMRLVNKLVNDVSEHYEAFVKTRRLSYAVDSSPFYRYLRYRYRCESLDSLNVNTHGDIRILGAGGLDPFVVTARQNACQRAATANACMNPVDLLNRERFYLRSACALQPVCAGQALGWTVEHWLPDQHHDNVQVLQLQESVVVRTVPRYSSNAVHWSRVFAPPKAKTNPWAEEGNNTKTASGATRWARNEEEDKFGLVVRRDMLTLRNETDRPVINGVFTANGGELMALPYPFIVRGCESDSSLVAKTPNGAYPYSCRTSTVTETDELGVSQTRVATQQELDDETARALALFRYERTAMVLCMSPVFHSTCYTGSSSQGMTSTTYNLIDRSKILPGDELVVYTRVNDTQKLVTANVYETAITGTKRMAGGDRHEEMAELRRKKRALTSATIHLYDVRQ